MSEMVLIAIINLCNGGLGCISELKAENPKTVQQAIDARGKLDDIQRLQQQQLECETRYGYGYVGSITLDYNTGKATAKDAADIRNREKLKAECRLEVQKKIDLRRTLKS